MSMSTSSRSNVMLAYYGILIVSACGVAAAPILVRVSEVTPTATLWLRMCVALLLLTALPFGRGESGSSAPADRPPPRPAAIRFGIVFTGLLACADMIAAHWAVRLTSVANCTLLINVTPVFVIVIAYFFLRERQSALSVTGVAVALAGALVLVGASYAVGGQQLLGDGLALSSALIYSVYIVLTKALRNWVSATRLLKWHTGLICLFLIPLVAFGDSQVFPLTARGWVIIAALAVISQLIGHGLLTFAMKRVSAGISSMSTLITPILSAIMAWQFLGEPIQSNQLVGGGLVLTGIALYALHDLRLQRG
jgi:drug/metabolite transporter (DMT)-like permease